MSWRGEFQHLTGAKDNGGVLRVNQLDGLMMEQEVQDALLEPIRACQPLLQFTAELKLLVRLILLWPFLNDGRRFGDTSQNVVYARTMNRKLRIVYIAMHACLPYCQDRITKILSMSGWSESPENSIKNIVWRLWTRFEQISHIINLVNFLMFIWNGHYRSLTDRVLKLRMRPIQAGNLVRQLDLEYVNRVHIWEAFAIFADSLIPFVPFHFFRRQYTALMGKISTDGEKYKDLPRYLCAFCVDKERDVSKHSQSLITLPYISQCGHIACYYCLSRAKQDADQCPRCSAKITAISIYCGDLESTDITIPVAEKEE
jgi:peroxin-2